jgi:hypothetical protein
MWGETLVFPPDADVANTMRQWGVDTVPESRRKKELAAEEIMKQDLIAEGFPPELIQRLAHEKLTGYRAQRLSDPVLGTMEVRRMEVNGYAERNPIPLEHSEWTKAQQLGDTYWLYVVSNPLSKNHRLVNIQNPYRVLEDSVKHRQIIRRCESGPRRSMDTQEDRPRDASASDIEASRTFAQPARPGPSLRAMASASRYPARRPRQ